MSERPEWLEQWEHMTLEERSRAIEEAVASDPRFEAGLMAVAERMKAFAPMVQAWQPIGTAPKDETEILLWFSEMEACHTGSWDGRQWRIDYAEGDHSDWVVTHWMPLPDPPEVKP